MVLCKTFKLSWDKENTYVLVYQHGNNKGSIHMSMALLDTPKMYTCLTIKREHIEFIGEATIDKNIVLSASSMASSIDSWRESYDMINRAARVKATRRNQR